MKKLSAAIAAALLGLAAMATPASAGDETLPCASEPVWQGHPLREAPELPAEAIFAPVGAAQLAPALAARLDETLQAGADGAPAASATVLLSNGALWSGSVGSSADSIFQAASITKSVTAAIVLKLIEAGKLSLDTPLSVFYDDLPNADLITVDHLLRNISGLQLAEGDGLDDRFTPRSEDIAALRDSEAEFCPGTNYSYSNIGWRLLGGIIEQVTGLAYADAVEAYVISPLNLSHTFIARPGERDPRLVPAFHQGERLGDIEYATAGAAGALASTPAELATFWRSVLNGELISTGSRDLMFNPIADMYAPESIAYGRGAMVFYKPGAPSTVYGHPGGMKGFSTAMYYLAEEQAIIVVMINDRTHSSEDLLGKLHAVVREEQ